MNVASWNGDWDELIDVAGSLRRSAEAESVPQVELWAVSWFVWVESTRNPFGSVIRDAETDVDGWIRDDEDMPLADEVLARACLLVAHLRRGEWDAALAAATGIEEVLGNAQPVAIYLLPTYCAMADLYFALCQAGYVSDTVTARELRSRLRRMHFRIQVFSTLMPMSAPLRYLSAGRILLLKGRTRKACRTFRKGIGIAEKYRTPYFIGMLETELARAVDSGTERDALNATARDRFRLLGIENPEVLSLRCDLKAVLSERERSQ